MTVKLTEKPASKPAPRSRASSVVGAIAGPARPVLIEVFANDTPEGVAFTHVWKFEDIPGDPMKPGTIDLPHGKTAYRLRFRLNDNTRPSKQLKFKNPCTNAMYVAVGGPCPPPAGNGGGQIQFNYPWTPYLLTVDDMNHGNPVLLKYALRFDGEPGHEASNPLKLCPPYEYDPDLKNGGGNN